MVIELADGKRNARALLQESLRRCTEKKNQLLELRTALADEQAKALEQREAKLRRLLNGFE
jgi:hypothetical protein